MKNERNEKKMRNRMALLGVLLLAGFLMAGIGTALGTGKAFQGRPDVFSASVVDGQVVVSKNGEVVDRLAAPADSENITIETSNGGVIVMGRLTSEEIKKQQAEHEAELNSLLESAKKDAGVQSLIAGKNYTVIGAAGMGQSGTNRNKISVLILKVEDKYYKITISENGSVLSVLEDTVKTTIGGYSAFDVGSSSAVGQK